MNKSLKYKLDTAEIIAFIAGVLLIIGVKRYLFTYEFFSVNEHRLGIVVFIIAIVAALFGEIAGGFTGFLGTVCAMAVCGDEVNFAVAVSLAVYGCIIGQFADKYMIRDGRFSLNLAYLFLGTNLIGAITCFIFVKPLISYIGYSSDLINGIMNGTKVAVLCAFPLGVILTAVLFIVSFFRALTKRH